jgi:hypothetical protein
MEGPDVGFPSDFVSYVHLRVKLLTMIAEVHRFEGELGCS